jgi:hypothetical protein
MQRRKLKMQLPKNPNIFCNPFFSGNVRNKARIFRKEEEGKVERNKGREGKKERKLRREIREVRVRESGKWEEEN